MSLGCPLVEDDEFMVGEASQRALIRSSKLNNNTRTSHSGIIVCILCPSHFRCIAEHS